MKESSLAVTGPGSIALSGCVAIVVLFCSCATPYRPLKNGAGYSEVEVAPNQFRVSFQGNADTPLDRVYDFASLRAAEIARQHGFSYFAVLDAINTSSAKEYKVRQLNTLAQSQHTDRSPFVSPAVAPYGTSTYRPDPILTAQTHEETRIYFKPSTSLVIKCFSTKPEKPFVFDATELMQQLKQKYGL